MDEQITIYDTLADIMIGNKLDYVNDHWQSDWNGDEVGFPDVPVVGLYSLKNQPIDYYVDTETGVILDAWSTEDSED